ncbi:MAG: hypothetical protein M0R46_10490 [Candidatus Muirbacterium halophilum]|nr:hypothetical protein [Candidatus Muirbacterium halophilum]
MANKEKKVVGFKKFSELNSELKVQEIDLSVQPLSDSDLPCNPNLPIKTNKIEKTSSRDNLIPKKQNILTDNGDDDLDTKNDIDLKKKVNESVQKIGKIAKFPKNSKASEAYSYLEHIKVSKKSIWYMVIEQMENSGLQLVKYNNMVGVDLNKFINELKTYYLSENCDNKVVYEAISKIEIEGNSSFSVLKNIPPIKVDGVMMITKITEDLIKLLSK